METILVINDKNDNLASFSAIIKEMLPGSRVLTARSGKEGIKKAITDQPDVIMLDIIMPEMDGFETCRRLKSDKKTVHIPVILITAIRTDVDSRVRGLEIGADAFLHKPIDHAELAAQVKVMLRIRGAEQQLRKEKGVIEVKYNKKEVYLGDVEDRFEQIFTQAPVGIEVYDEEGKLIDINKECLNIFGVNDSNEVKGFKFFEDPNITDKIKKRLLGGKPVSYDMKFDFELVRKNKLYKTSRSGVADLNLHITPYNISSGGGKGYLVHVLEITKQKNAEKELKESQEHWRSLTESSPYHIMVLDLDGTIKLINRTVQDLSPEEVIGKSVFDFTPPDYHEVARTCYKKVKQTLEYQDYQTEYQTKNGQHRYFGVRVGPILEDGKITSFISCSTDNTDKIYADLQLKESEEKFRLLHINSPDMTLLQDPDGELVYISPQVENVLGYSEEEFLGKSFPDQIHPDDRDKAYEILMKALGGEDILNVEYRFFGGDQKVRWLSHTARPVFSEGKMVRLQSSIRDITRRKESEIELAKYRMQMEELVKERTIELETKNEKLENFNSLFVGREFRIKELKDQVLQLEEGLKKNEENK